MADRVVLFDSIHHALAAEKRLLAAGLWADLVPVPKALSSDCGLALAFREADSDAVFTALSGCRWRSAWRREGGWTLVRESP